ncbi:hypothetical protein GV828_12445 [Flavobacterium sp. NST-5]|uniref:YD repeat-containing protein n=1 Tax=Flavobacterium ichthyis TaxID=2698827 RepID=A0ABW9ZBC1_9FLAO|nr:hypothetical protein [Flavobacterium ichthyis]NBL66009.1 hypothetical protein [Flavobacterium ichthyis]
MKTTILLLLIFFNINLSAQTIDWKNAPLNPAAVFYTTNHFNVNGPIKEFSAKSRGGEIFYLHFNESGKLVEKITSQAAGTNKIQFTYQYDAKGKLISEITAFLDSKGAKTYESKTSITVNDKGLVTKNGSMICSYDNNDRLISVINKDKNGKVIYRQEFVYNTLGQVISEKITDPHAATGVMETEEFKFTYTKNNRGGWDVAMHIYKEGKLATKGSIPLITSSFVRQKREQISNNPKKFSFDEAGLEAFDPNIVSVMVDQYNNLRGQFVIRLKQDFYPVNITYYNNILSVAKPKKPKESNTVQTTSTIKTTELISQTTETRLYNGKYNQETALTAINKYIDNLKKLGTYSFVGGATKTYQIDGIWTQKISEQDKGTLNIRYIIGDNHLTIELISAILNKNGKAIMLYPQSSDETIRKLYHNQVGMFVNGLFSYLGINDNASTITKTSTVNNNITVQNNTKVANSTVNNVDPYSGLSAEAGAYMAAYRMNLNGLKSYLENQLKSWEQKGYAADQIIQSYTAIFKEVYTKSPDAAFELLMKLPQRVALTKLLPNLTDEQRDFVRKKSKERLQKYSGSYSSKTN